MVAGSIVTGSMSVTSRVSLLGVGLAGTLFDAAISTSDTGPYVAGSIVTGSMSVTSRFGLLGVGLADKILCSPTGFLQWGHK